MVGGRGQGVSPTFVLGCQIKRDLKKNAKKK